MAFLRFAKATLVKPGITPNIWDGVRTAAAAAPTSLSHNLIDRAADIFQKPFDPARYLLSHATIVASVDVEEPPNAKVGSFRENGFKVNRKYADYRITTASERWINNNDDAWGRDVLLKSYPTFVGGQNFCFAPDTPILLDDGTYKPIQDIQIGDLVVSHTGKAKRVTHLFERPFAGQIRAIKLNHYKEPILATGNHPFRGISVQTPPIKKRAGSKISSTVRYRKDQIAAALRGDSHPWGDAFSAEAQWIPAEQLESASYLLGAEQSCSATTSCVDRAALLGYYLAEGGVSNGMVYFCFGPHEKRLAEDAASRLRRVFPGSDPRIHKTQTTLKLAVYRQEVAAWFFEYGSRLSHDKKISNEVMSWDRASIMSLVAAWLSGDGDFHNQTQRLRGHTVSQQLAQQICFLLEKCGIKASAVCVKKRIGEVESRVELVVGGAPRSFDIIPRHHVWTVTISKEHVSEVMSYSKRWPVFPIPQRKRSDFAWWGKKQRVFKIASNTPIPYDGLVYNFEVEDDHSYVVAPGVAVHNCEHVQVDELSKGRIVDAVARDVGESVYVDILIATDATHRDLIASIQDGRMATLSMGCTIDFSQCTRCGHVAADETEMCQHVRYEKGNTYFDEQGVKRRVAELCGHHTVDPTGGVQFIEASWVGTPAFAGAVLRNVLEQEQAPEEIHRKAQEILSSPPKEWAQDAMAKAAQDKTAFDMGDDDDEGDDDGDKEPEQPPIEQVEEELEQHILERVKKRIKDKLRSTDVSESLKPEDSTAAPNNNVIRQAISIEGRSKKSASYRAGLFALVRTASTDAEMVDKIAALNGQLGINIPVEVYRAILRVGSVGQSVTLPEFAQRCSRFLGRKPTLAELRTMIRLGQLLNVRHQLTQKEKTL